MSDSKSIENIPPKLQSVETNRQSQSDNSKSCMLTPQEILALLDKISPGYRGPDHEVIKRSNEMHRPKYKKMGIVMDYDVFFKKEPQQQNPAKNVDCNVPGCNATFENITDYHSHFNCNHRFNCSECKRSLPTAHLLDLHLSERHDSYFAAKVERGTEPMYACYLKTCDLKMMTPEARKDHCVTEHKMPANFRFDQTKKKKSPKDRSKSSAAGPPEAQQPMEVCEDKESTATKNLPYIKAFSFGHHTERTFNTRKNTAKRKPGKTLENVDELRDALPDLME